RGRLVFKGMGEQRSPAHLGGDWLSRRPRRHDAERVPWRLAFESRARERTGRAQAECSGSRHPTHGRSRPLGAAGDPWGVKVALLASLLVTAPMICGLWMPVMMAMTRRRPSNSGMMRAPQMTLAWASSSYVRFWATASAAESERSGPPVMWTRAPVAPR